MSEPESAEWFITDGHEEEEQQEVGVLTASEEESHDEKETAASLLHEQQQPQLPQLPQQPQQQEARDTLNDLSMELESAIQDVSVTSSPVAGAEAEHPPAYDTTSPVASCSPPSSSSSLLQRGKQTGKAALSHVLLLATQVLLFLCKHKDVLLSATLAAAVGFLAGRRVSRQDIALAVMEKEKELNRIQSLFEQYLQNQRKSPYSTPLLPHIFKMLDLL